jgi:hypothetical protein
VEAGLRVGSDDAAYRCAGRGPFVLALSRRDDARFGRHCEAMAAEARVVVPVIGERAPRACRGWLRGLLDAFGADRATIVTDDTSLLDALLLALACPERVAAVRLLSAGGDAPAASVDPCLVPFTVERYIS